MLSFVRTSRAIRANAMRLVTTRRAPAVSVAGQRFSSSRDRDFGKLESASEAAYIDKQDREMLQRVLQRWAVAEDPIPEQGQGSSPAGDKSPIMEGQKCRVALDDIYEKHGLKLDSALKEDLFEWKNDGHHAPKKQTNKK